MSIKYRFCLLSKYTFKSAFEGRTVFQLFTHQVCGTPNITVNKNILKIVDKKYISMQNCLLVKDNFTVLSYDIFILCICMQNYTSANITNTETRPTLKT